ncbi:MAG TPA: glycosyltransferase family 1 protein [Acidimicrobiales bacterium]|jgi:glycosyltransferase involved in cell wall biosynthesis|nr:glycosyltransferase family 1 protein [Acidimicrobiales bacterium]
MRLAFDLTALHDRRTGVGAFAREVLTRVARHDDIDVVGYSVSWRGRNVSDLGPAGVRVATRPMAARPLRELWRRFDWPPITWWTGPVDVVHGPNFVVPPAHGAGALATVHDLTFIRYPELCTPDVLQYGALLRRAVRRGAHMHTVSQFVADEVVDAFAVESSRVHVVPNGVDPIEPGDAAVGCRLAGGDRYVLALGTIEPRKDLPSLVAAFDALAGADHELRLIVAGQDGWGTNSFDQAAGRAHHRERIVRLGFVDDASRAALLAGASAFAYPSKYEGFGLAPLEAMAAGIPVVTTRTGALPEVLGDAARFVPPGAVDELAAALAAVLDDSPARSALVTAGRARAARYSWDECADGIVRVYQRLC